MINRRTCTDTSRSQAGGVGLTLALLIAVIGLIAITFLYFVFGQVVPPGFVGVRQNGYSIWGVLEKGYSNKGLEPGLHWRVPGFSDIVLLPRTFQFVHFNSEPQHGDLDLPGLDIPTKDGSKVKADITLVARLYHDVGQGKEKAEEEPLANEKEVPFATHKSRVHGGPKELVERFTAESREQLRRLSVVAQNKLNQNLSSLLTIDFYNPVLRERATLRAYEQANDEISRYGIEVWGTLLRRFGFAEKNIDDQIFAKILQEQTERLSAAASRLAAAKAETEKEQALGDAKIKDLEVNGEAQVRVLRSEGDLSEAKKRAAGDLLVATAKADVDAAKARALHDIAGADIYVARELAPLLSTLQGGVVTDIDPYNIKEWVQKLTSKNQ